MYHDDCLVFCAKVLSLGEFVESVSGATELDDRARYYWVIVTRMTGAAGILQSCSAQIILAPWHSRARRQCQLLPEGVYNHSAPATLHQVEHFRFAQFPLPITQALPSLRTSHLPITFTFTCGEWLPAYRSLNQGNLAVLVTLARRCRSGARPHSRTAPHHIIIRHSHIVASHRALSLCLLTLTPPTTLAVPKCPRSPT